MSDLRSLIEAAKADTPSAAVRAKVWTGVTETIGGAAAGGAAVASAASAAKMLFLGTLFGGALTVGIGGALLFAGPPPRVPETRTESAERAPDSAPAIQRFAAIQATGSGVDPTMNPRPGVKPSARSTSGASAGAKRTAVALPVKAAEERVPSAPARRPDAVDGALAREASLLGAARNALAQKDATTALQIVRKLRALPAGQLIPEELAVEAQSLRALGLDGDAAQVETTLRVRFPDSVLGR